MIFRPIVTEDNGPSAQASTKVNKKNKLSELNWARETMKVGVNEVTQKSTYRVDLTGG